jgi:long-chain acyl-CoA synthetase
VIASHPAVAMVAVAALPDPEKGEIAKAFIVLKPGSELTEEGLSTHCRAYLAAYKYPRPTWWPMIFLRHRLARS